MTGDPSAHGRKNPQSTTAQPPIRRRSSRVSKCPLGKAMNRYTVRKSIGPSASTPRSNANGQSDDCHDMTHAVMPKAISSGPKRLSGRRRHQYRPTSIGITAR
jgi:hypothetical protein